MSGIVSPKLDDLCSEGFRMIASRAPTPEELVRAVNVWVEEILTDVWQFATHQDITRLKTLENSVTLLLTKGRRRYALPDDFHRPISATFLEPSVDGVVAPMTDAHQVPAEDGQTYLLATADSALGALFSPSGPSYAMSGRYLAMTSGVASGEVREIVVANPESLTVPGSPSTWAISHAYVRGDFVKGNGFTPDTVYVCLQAHTSGTATWPGSTREWQAYWAPVTDGAYYDITINGVWQAPQVPGNGDTFSVATIRGRWLDEEMREYMDEVSSRVGLGFPFSFVNFDRDIELDVAPDKGYVLMLRYWTDPRKVEKDSAIFRRIILNWRNAITQGVRARTAMALDDNRYVEIKREYDMAVLALVEHEYDYTPKFDRFASRRKW